MKKGKIPECVQAYYPGIHFCHGWDELLVWRGAPEWESCPCYPRDARTGKEICVGEERIINESVRVEVGKTGDIIVSLLERIEKLEKALAGVECSVCEGEGFIVDGGIVGCTTIRQKCLSCGGTGKVVRPLEE